MPGEIAQAVMAPGGVEGVADPFECSLCDLCGAVCPEKLSPAGLFLEMRRQAVEQGALDLRRYKTILGYEARGQSERYSWYGLPQGCDTVFFPGCTLPGTRPEATWRIFHLLRQETTQLGIVLDCCAKPSHDLGRAAHFHASFSSSLDYLSAHGISNVWVACPNCYKIFEQYGKKLEVVTVWERLLAVGAFQAGGLSGPVMVHDPCPLRYASGIQEAVREGITQMGLSIREARHRKKLTLCCGEGGSVGFINPAFAKKWGARRKGETEGERLITYCAGCAEFLKRAGAKVTHLADFLVSPDAAAEGRAKVSGAPWTYWNRIKLKKRFQKAVVAANSARQPASIRRAGADACTLEECRSVLCRKGAGRP
jgi:Fe-S oxidoreductase